MRLKKTFALSLTLILSLAVPMGSKIAHSSSTEGQTRSEESDYPITSKYLVSTSDDTMKKVAAQYDVVLKRDDGYEVLVPQRDAARFLELTPSARLLEADIDSDLRARSDWGAAYHDFAKVKAHLDQTVADFASLATYEVYGKSKEGRELYALKLTSKLKPDAGKPQIVLTSATHGNELITVEVVLGLLDELTKNYGKESRVTDIVDNHQIFFLPVINPDGYVRKSRYANGVDPNREYPYPDNENRKPNAAIQAVMDFFGSHDIKGSIDFHSYGNLVMYPWSYTRTAPAAADATAFASMVKSMASTNGYTHGQISRILYTAVGSSADYYYWKHKTFAIAVELGNAFAPKPSQIPNMIQDQKESTLRFLESFK